MPALGSHMYVSVSELKDRLGITDTDRDFALDRAIEAASRHIDRTLGTRFYTTPGVPEIRYYSATNCTWQLRVDDLLSLTEVATDENGDGTYETVWTEGVDFILGPANALYTGDAYNRLDKLWWTGRFYFPVYDRAVRITSEAFGRCTIANVPPGIREASLLLAQNYAWEVLDATMAGVGTYKLGNELTLTMGTRDVPPIVNQILRQFQPAGGFIY
jgi:hypothetical protein